MDHTASRASVDHDDLRVSTHLSSGGETPKKMLGRQWRWMYITCGDLPLQKTVFCLATLRSRLLMHDSAVRGGVRLIDTSRRGARDLSFLHGRDCAARKVRASASEVKGVWRPRRRHATDLLGFDCARLRPAPRLAPLERPAPPSRTLCCFTSCVPGRAPEGWCTPCTAVSSTSWLRGQSPEGCCCSQVSRRAKPRTSRAAGHRSACHHGHQPCRTPCTAVSSTSCPWGQSPEGCCCSQVVRRGCAAQAEVRADCRRGYRRVRGK